MVQLQKIKNCPQKVLQQVKACIVLISLLFFLNCTGQISTDKFITLKFENIDENPSLISFSNNKKVNNFGGHLQGIQLMSVDTPNYAILSGSSDSYAYYMVVKLGEANEVISVNRLMDKPFKHAGGIQVFEKYLAVGIEDNEKKDKSKVCIYNISTPENPSVKPIAVIEREGNPKRSTAGCVGITKYKNKALVVVGDWDTKNIDFYSCNFDEIKNNNFELIYSINTEKMSKTGWIDSNWHSYQNINLINFKNDLYLVGLGQNNKKEDIADLFSLKEASTNNFYFTKLAKKTFQCNNEISFKAGAGVVIKKSGEIGIISCGYHTDNTTYLNYFDKVKD